MMARSEKPESIPNCGHIEKRRYPKSKEALEGIRNEVKYLRQEVEFLKKILKTENTAARKS